MKLVLIFGPPAVGKMSVGKALAEKTGLKLFYNHMTIEPVLGVFDWADPQFRKLVNEFRRRVFEEVANSHLKGLIYTYVWNFGEPGEREMIDTLCDIFRAKGVEPFFVELRTDLDTRLHRNVQPDRLEAKASKRDTKKSEEIMMNDVKKYIMNTKEYGKFYYPDHHIVIDNTDLSPDDVAERIIARFSLV